MTDASPALPDDELRETLELLSTVMASVSDRVDAGQVNKAIYRAQKMILWNVVVYRKLIKQCALRLLLRTQHLQFPRIYKEIESAVKPQIKKSFSTK